MPRRPDQATRERARAMFAAHLRLSGDVRAAARHAGVSARTGWRWSSKDAQAPVPRVPLATGLPRPRGGLHGREASLDAIHRVLRRAGLVTIVGPPGIGKTRLAVGYAELFLPSYARAGGVWFCDLAHATSLDDLLRVVARALGLDLAELGGMSWGEGGKDEAIAGMVGLATLPRLKASSSWSWRRTSLAVGSLKVPLWGWGRRR